MSSGLVAALAILLIFPINYLASSHDEEWDFSYFRTASAGSSTLALVRGLSDPIEIFLFYSPGNDVKEQLLPYFRALESAAGANVVVEVVDQPVRPTLSEELKIRDNGYIVLRQGEAVEKFKVDEELRRAKRELKKLDGTVQKHLLKLTRGKRTAYMLVGHGEANARQTDDLGLKLALFKRKLVDQSYLVKDFGVDDGSLDAVPDDAALVIVAAPDLELLPGEVETLTTYLDGGGSLLAMVDVDRDPMTDLLAHVGVEVGEHPLATVDMNSLFPIGRRLTPYQLLTTSYGTHPVASTLSKRSSQLWVGMPAALPILEIEGHAAERSVLLRTKPDTWEDITRDGKKADDESSKVWTLGMASTGGAEGSAWRAVVLGDVTMFSDPMLGSVAGNDQLVDDTFKWLVGDEDIAGETTNEEDVKIRHTREQDVAWFYGLTFMPPVFVMLLGGAIIRMRRRRS